MNKQSDFYVIGNKRDLLIAWRQIRTTPMRHFIRHADTLVKCRMRVNSLADVNKTNKFSPEVRKPAVRLVYENRGEYPSRWAAVESIAAKICCVSQTLLEWFKREKVDGGQRDGLTSSERERIKALKREVKELRHANEILKPTGTCFCSGGA